MEVVLGSPGNTCTNFQVWLTNLVDAERGLQLLLRTDRSTMFTPQPVHDLKGAFGPFVAVFLQFGHEVIARKVALPSSPGGSIFILHFTTLQQLTDMLRKQPNQRESQNSPRNTWKSAGEIWLCSADLHAQVWRRLFETTVQTGKEKKAVCYKWLPWIIMIIFRVQEMLTHGRYFSWIHSAGLSLKVTQDVLTLWRDLKISYQS